MTDFHWHLVLVWWQVSLSIGIMGAASAAYYFRNKYFDISERMHNAIQLIDAGQTDVAREILSEH